MSAGSTRDAKLLYTFWSQEPWRSLVQPPPFKQGQQWIQTRLLKAFSNRIWENSTSFPSVLLSPHFCVPPRLDGGVCHFLLYPSFPAALIKDTEIINRIKIIKDIKIINRTLDTPWGCAVVPSPQLEYKPSFQSQNPDSFCFMDAGCLEEQLGDVFPLHLGLPWCPWWGWETWMCPQIHPICSHLTEPRFLKRFMRLQ